MSIIFNKRLLYKGRSTHRHWKRSRSVEKVPDHWVMRVNRRRSADDPGEGKGKPKRNPTATRHVPAGADAAQTESKRKKLSTIITATLHVTANDVCWTRLQGGRRASEHVTRKRHTFC